MTKEQEQLAERIIKIHQIGNGVFDWQRSLTIFSKDPYDRLVVKRALEDKNLIESLNPNSSVTRLKEPEGWIFTTFEDERQKEQEKQNTKAEMETIRKEIDKLTLRKLTYEQFPAKFWWLIIIGTAIISIGVTLVNNQIEKSNNQTEIQPKEKP